MVAEFETPDRRATSQTGHSNEIEAWLEADKIAGVEYDLEDIDRPHTDASPTVYGKEAGEYIAAQAVTIKEANQSD